MTGLVDWAAARARMVLAFIAISLTIGAICYASLPKEGEPDIQIPALFVSVPFPGISAADAETLLVKPMETELADLDGLKTMSSTASEGYAGVALEFEFGWDKTEVMADVRDAMKNAEGEFPEGAETYSVNEINFSEFPIIIVNLSGPVPERTMATVAKDLQDKLEALDSVLEAGIAGNRDEMLEVLIDPLRLESYNVTAGDLINVVQNNNQLIAAGEIESEGGAFAVKIPSSFSESQDVYSLPVKTNGTRVVTLGDLAHVNLTFEDREGTARFNGDDSFALQVVKRKGFNIIDTVAEVQATLAQASGDWPDELKAAVNVGTSNDQSRQVNSMVGQLEGSVLTAIALVMVVVLASLGLRPALLVGFAIPTSFLLCFVLLALMGITISNIVMFGLILAVGMLVDGAIVVVEYADKRIAEGEGPMRAYVEAAKRMFWPVISSTATTLCAFLPMLFWPGVPGQFMGMLPVTLIFVLSASLVVALVYLPVMGGVSGRFSRVINVAADALRARLPWMARAALAALGLLLLIFSALLVINPTHMNPEAGTDFSARMPAIILFLAAAVLSSIFMGAAEFQWERKQVETSRRLTPFGQFMKFIVGNPVMPIVAIGSVLAFVVMTFGYYGQNQNGVEFFVETEPEQSIIYVKARGNLSLSEKDALVRRVEAVVDQQMGIDSVFAFAGEGGLSNNTGGSEAPKDTIGQVQIELIPWEDRAAYGIEYGLTPADLDGDVILAQLEQKLSVLPGFETEIINLTQGPASAKPVHLRIKGDNWDDLLSAASAARTQFEATPGLTLIEDTMPLPGIDWEIDVDVEKAGRYGADVATVGAMVQLVTRGIFLDSYTPDGSDEEIEIRVRLPEEYRVLATLDTLKVRTEDGLVPLSNFITRHPVPKLAEITRVGQKRYFDVKAGVDDNLTTFVSGDGEDGEIWAYGTALSEGDEGDFAFNDTQYALTSLTGGISQSQFSDALDTGDIRSVPLTPDERIAALNTWLDTDPLPMGIEHEWTGDQEDQAESAAFLQSAFSAALGLMFIILLAQFNSFYNSVLVLLAVVLSVTGVLWGMLIMGQKFSIIMTGTGIVALAGIVVNNNIVLIDTYQEYSRYMPRIEAIIRTAQDRLRPVLLTTITTMAGLAPMMFGLSLDFINGGYTIDSPTALWWKGLATAVVFGLGIATVLTLVITPSLLALRIWAVTYLTAFARLLGRMSMGRASAMAQDYALNRAAKRAALPTILWDEDETDLADRQSTPSIRAAE